MPDSRRHRGPHPQDRRLFGIPLVPVLRRSVGEMSWLLSRDYPEQAALKLVGDRHGLTARQRKAVARCACGDGALERRRGKYLDGGALLGSAVAIDGFNCLITLESALSGAVLFRGRDGAYRDMASVHGSYRRVEETARAIEAVGRCLSLLGVTEVTWFLDRPVSNSGRVSRMIETAAGKDNLPWRAVLCANPDLEVAVPGAVAGSSDSWILDRCERWTDIPALVLERVLPDERAWIVDLAEPFPV